MWKSTYEIIYKALDYPPNKWDDKKEQTMVVVAESDSDTRREAEKILKKQGYDFIHICSSKRLKYVNSDMKTEDLYKTYNKKLSKSGPIATLLSIILIPIFIVVMISSCIKSKKPVGTWKLVEITGTADVRANYDQNYMELKDGTALMAELY